MIEAVEAEVVVIPAVPVTLTRKYHVEDEVTPETRIVTVVPTTSLSVIVAAVQVVPSTDCSTSYS